MSDEWDGSEECREGGAALFLLSFVHNHARSRSQGKVGQHSFFSWKVHYLLTITCVPDRRVMSAGREWNDGCWVGWE